MQVTFTDVLRGQNFRINVSLRHLGVRKQLENWYLPFKGFNGKRALSLRYLKFKDYFQPKNKLLRD